MPNIYELVTADNLKGYIESKDQSAQSNEIPMLGDALFPSVKQAGLEISWIKGANNLPVALKPAAFDAKAPVRDRQGFKKLETELPFFREAMRVGEKDRQNIMNALAANNESLYSTLIARIYDDVGTLVAGAKVQPERMRMQLLSTGKIGISANGIAYDYDYNMPDNHKTVLTSTDKWDDAGSDPLNAIENWMDLIETDTGERPSRALTTRKVLGYLRNHPKVKAALLPENHTSKRVSVKDVVAYLLEEFNLQVITYEKKFQAEDGTVKNFFPDNLFTLLPAGTLGETVYSTTPEEADLMSGAAEADVSVINTGVAVLTRKETHPVNVQTIVSEIVLPTFPAIDKIFIATVAGA